MTTLKSFLKEVGGNEKDIISYSWEEAMKAVKQDWNVLKYIKEQTEEMCIEAVKQNWYALKYVKEQTESICIEAVKQDWHALQYVKEQTESICIEAVKESWYALRYVDKTIFDTDIKEYTMEELQEKLWEDFKLIK